MKLDDICKEVQIIYDYFTDDNQREKLHEECLEYLDCIDIDAEDEEIADIFIVALQLVLNNKEVMKYVALKIKRTKLRIIQGYYK